MLIAFVLGVLLGAGLTVLLSLAGVGVFTLFRVRQAHRDAKDREARILAAVAQERQAELRPLPSPAAYAFPWLPRNRMD